MTTRKKQARVEIYIYPKMKKKLFSQACAAEAQKAANERKIKI